MVNLFVLRAVLAAAVGATLAGFHIGYVINDQALLVPSIINKGARCLESWGSLPLLGYCSTMRGERTA